MVDVVYTMSSESNFDDMELMYSLRSLSNLDELGKVFIVGSKPRWVDPYKVIHIPCFDSYKSNKDGNLIAKLLITCFENNLSEKFLWFSDDQILLQKTPISIFENPSVANYHLDFNKQERLNRWQTRLRRTVDILKERGYPHNCYEGHIPYMLNKELFPKILLQYDYGYDIGYCGNTLYFNTLRVQGRENIDKILFRATNKIPNIELWESSCKEKYFLNYTDQAIDNVMFNFLQKKFSIKSKYEI